MSYDTVLPVYGPLVLPPVVPGRECSHHAPESCPACDGQEADERELRRCTPTERQAHYRAMREWRASTAPTNTETDPKEAT